MVYSFGLEHKRNNATNFKGMHLYMLFMLYHPEKNMNVFCRECTRDLVQAMILNSLHSKEQAVEASSSRFD
jgi:hypothetical protein